MYTAEAWDNKITYLVREEEYRGYLEAARTGIVYLDAQLQVRNLNREAERIFGLERDRAIGNGADVVFRHCGEEFHKAFTLAEHDEFFAANVRLQVNDQATYVHVDSLRLQDQEGGAGGIIIIVQDISAVRATIKQIQTTQMLMSLGELAAGVVHHVRAPLTTVGGYLQFMVNRLEDDRCTVGREVLETLLREVSHINNVVKELVMFAKPPLRKEPGVDVNKVVEDALRLVFREMGGESVTIDKQLAADLPTLTADANLLKQALVNVCQNALEAMPEFGVLTARSWLNAELQMLVVAIADTGAGVEPHVLARAFEPFYSTKLDRTGLGLPTAHRIVVEHGGFINISSDERRGTKVHIYLPIVDGRGRVPAARQELLNLQ